MHEVDQVRKDGSVVPTEVVTTLLPGADGRVTMVLGVSRDITERKRWEWALQESEDKFRAVVENAPDAIFIQVGSGLPISTLPPCACLVQTPTVS